MEPPANASDRVIGFFQATGIGVAAIVGGGVLALAGPAFLSAGPSATLAVALGGVIALFTAMSFAELATAFPQSGGAYVFANKVLSIRAAFAVGWVLWFAYIVACVLYAMGFAAYAVLLLRELCGAVGWTPEFLTGRAAVVVLAGVATAYYVIMLIRHASGGGHWITVAKIVLFGVLIVAGAVALVFRPLDQATARLDPFFSGGFSGLVHAMGLTFVILHGFEVIAAVGGEVKDPGRVIPKSMFLSVAISLAVYVPLLLVALLAGVPDGTSLREFSVQHGETMIAAAVREYMGPIGYWLVIVVAILAFLSALRANLMGGSRIARSMALDRTLPVVLGRLDGARRTPAMAIYATGLAVVVVLLIVPNVEAAGAAASLIFLLSFALVHVTAYLARTRVKDGGGSYRTPFFPLIPALGVVGCGGLALFEAIAIPDAGSIAAIWLGFGVILYVALFKTHAEIADATAEALDPTLGRFRGKTPLVLVPIANPAQARNLVEMANALAPTENARVLLLSIVQPPKTSNEDPVERLADAQRVVSEALTTSLRDGFTPDALISTSGSPWAQIRRLAQFHECETLLLGIGQAASVPSALSAELEDLVNDIECDVALMRAPTGWRLRDAKRIVVPIGGKGEEHLFRARVLGSLSRTAARDFHFVTVLDTASSLAQQNEAGERIRHLAATKVRGTPSVEVILDDDPIAGLMKATVGADLVVLGLKSVGTRRRVSSPISIAIANQASCASLLLSGRRSLMSGGVYVPLRGVVDAITDLAQRPVSTSSR